MNSIVQKINCCSEKLENILKMVSLEKSQRELSELDSLVNDDTLWSDPKKAATLLKDRQKVVNLVDKITFFQSQVSFYVEALQVMPDDLLELSSSVDSLYSELDSFEFKLMFKDPIDDTPALLTINAGAGGLEAANWVTILLRMYSRYADNKGFKIEILDMNPSEEHSSICTDSVSIRVEGPYAYGFLKNESGVHRLIRKSPFSSSSTRHTSFAAVNVSADIEDAIDIKIDEKDIEVTAMRAGGAGGQHQNKTNSAIRIKHIPTGINIAVRTERDSHANRRTAMKMLKAKLYDLELQKKMSEKEKIIAAQSDIAFGYQVRTYILDSPLLAKDHRTNAEIADANDVLNGNIENFILSLLRRS